MARPRALVSSAEPSARNRIPASAPPEVRPHAYSVEQLIVLGFWHDMQSQDTFASTYLHDKGIVGGEANGEIHALVL